MLVVDSTSTGKGAGVCHDLWAKEAEAVTSQSDLATISPSDARRDRRARDDGRKVAGQAAMHASQQLRLLTLWTNEGAGKET